MSGPAILALDDNALSRSEVGQKLFGSDNVKIAVQAMALGELLMDKLPFAPKRTDALSLLARAASGALIGASLYSSSKQPAWGGALIGGVSAVLATVASYHVRKVLTKNMHIPDTIVAIAEDALVFSRGVKMLQNAVSEKNAA
jgi:uncharacterized membrane protein